MKKVPAPRRLLSAIFLLVSGFLAADNPPSLGRVTLQLKWFHQFQFAGYYAAVEKGYYREEGLEVILKEGSPDMVFTDEVVSNRAEYGVHSTDILISRVKGQPLVVLGSIFQHSPLMLLSLKKSGLDIPQSFLGKRVMVSPDAEAEIYSIFNNEGMSQKEIRYIPHSWTLEDLVLGKTDAVSAYSTNEVLQLRLRGIDYSVLRPLTYGIDFYGDCLFTSEREVVKHPERVKAFLTASFKGWDYAMSHPEEIADLLLSKYKVRKSREVLLLEAEAMQELILPKLVPIGFMNPGRWKHIGDTYARLGVIPENYSLEGFLYDPDKPRLDPRTVKIVWTVLLALAVTGAIVAVSLLSFNRKLSSLVAERTKTLEDVNQRLGLEIAEGRRREGEIRRTLKERETLLKEIHHRVKNNLQVIISLVNMQIQTTDDPEADEALRGIMSRVHGMALVHEHLYLSESLSEIDIAGYLESFVSVLDQTFGGRGGSLVRYEVKAEGILLPIETAIPLGLLVGEVVSNSLKYAFPPGAGGRISIDLSRSETTGTYRLLVADDGSGAPPAVLKEKKSGLGLMLIEAFASQLKATLKIETENGFRVLVDGIRHP